MRLPLQIVYLSSRNHVCERQEKVSLAKLICWHSAGAVSSRPAKQDKAGMGNDSLTEVRYFNPWKTEMGDPRPKVATFQ
jgi:hypothetical protein